MEDRRSLDLLKTILVKYEEEQHPMQAPTDPISLTLQVLRLFPTLANERISLVDMSLREITTREQYISAVDQGVILVQRRELPPEAFAEWCNGCFWRWTKSDRKMHKIDALANSELTYSHYCVFLTENSMLFFSADNTFLFEFRSLNLTPKAKMNVGRYYFAYIFQMGYLYVLGGIDEAGYTDICERFDPVSNKWTYIVSHPGPGRTGMAACGFLNKFIFLFGGFDGISYLDHICKYSAEDGMWRALPVRLPTPTYYMCAVQYQSRLLLYGGKGCKRSYWLHPESLLITEGPSLPSDLSMTKFRLQPVITSGKVLTINLDYKVLEFTGNQWNTIYSVDS